jgi:gluconate 2-dehydrogenase gamma chain
MERRLVLRLIAAGFLAPRGLVSIAEAQSTPVYKPSFFSDKEMTALDRLSEIIIPADDHSPGASAALVNRYIDVVVSDGSAAGQTAWKNGLKAVNKESKRAFGKAFHKLSESEQEQVVATMAQNEGAPTNELERFFGALKRTTIDGYYTSKIGIHEDLQYQGNTALAEFPGCTHPEHQA